jgi:hypothetical protein
MEMEEDRIIEGFQQEVQKEREKSWHIKKGDLVLVYDSKFLQHPGKFRIHWLGPYEVKTITDGGVVYLKYLGGTKIIGMINGSLLNIYTNSQPPRT